MALVVLSKVEQRLDAGMSSSANALLRPRIARFQATGVAAAVGVSRQTLHRVCCTDR